MSQALRLLPIEAGSYTSHWFHHEDRDWPETNCYIDLWVELLHSLGLDPLACLSATVCSDFDGEQWDFFKPPLEDLRELYGINVREVNAWRPMSEHIIGHLQRGNLLTFETDAYHLPDTAGVSYGIEHQKTTIVVQHIDMDAKQLGYFHNGGYHEVGPAEFGDVLRLEDSGLPPYTELIDLSRMVRREPAELHRIALEQLRRHLADRPIGDPIGALAKRVGDDVGWLRANPELFHGYAFGTLRQLGAWAATTATFVEWLDDPRLTPAAQALAELSTVSKTCQFKLARLVAGRDTDLSVLFEQMSTLRASAYDLLVSVHGG